MKRILTILLILLFARSVYAAGSSTTVGTVTGAILQGKLTDVYCVSVVSIADDADGSIPDGSITGVGGYLVGVFMDWGATAPTSTAYDIYIKADSMADADLLGGAGVNLTTTADLWLTPLVGAVYAPAPFFGDLTISQAGNAVNDATPTAYLCFNK